MDDLLSRLVIVMILCVSQLLVDRHYDDDATVDVQFRLLIVGDGAAVIK